MSSSVPFLAPLLFSDFSGSDSLGLASLEGPSGSGGLSLVGLPAESGDCREEESGECSEESGDCVTRSLSIGLFRI